MTEPIGEGKKLLPLIVLLFSTAVHPVLEIAAVLEKEEENANKLRSGVLVPPQVQSCLDWSSLLAIPSFLLSGQGSYRY